ncbi:hypothetical protein ACKFKG_21385 [Phormidesmis sp. 146-35]
MTKRFLSLLSNRSHSTLLTTTLLLTSLLGGSLLTPAQAAPVASVKRAVTFSCSDTEATIKAKGGASVTIGTSSIYIGYQQVSSVNKDPRMIRFDNGRRTWCKSDYEVTNDDGTGYGLIWDGGSVLYGVFSSTGTQGTPSQDFRRFAGSGWLTNYGSGGGAKIAVLTRINPATGTISNATFLSALLSSGKSNSLVVKGLSLKGSNLVVNADSFFSPRRANRSRMTCSGSSPFNYTAEFASNLGSVVRATADRCQ